MKIFEVKLPSDNSVIDVARKGYTLVYSLSLLLSPECFRMHSFCKEKFPADLDYSWDFRVNSKNIDENVGCEKMRFDFLITKILKQKMQLT